MLLLSNCLLWYLFFSMKIWEKIMKKLWLEHFVFPEDKKDSHVCSWDSLFVDNLGATYYGYVFLYFSHSFFLSYCQLDDYFLRKFE